MPDGRLVPRMVPDGGIAGRIADRLEDLAGQIRRLSPDWQRPERFFERRSDIADELRHVARDAERERLG